MWSEKRLQDVDKIGVLLRFKNQFHYYHVCLCKDIGVCPPPGIKLEGTEKVDNTVYIWYNVSIKYRRCFYD